MDEHGRITPLSAEVLSEIQNDYVNTYIPIEIRLKSFGGANFPFSEFWKKLLEIKTAHAGYFLESTQQYSARKSVESGGSPDKKKFVEIKDDDLEPKIVNKIKRIQALSETVNKKFAEWCETSLTELEPKRQEILYRTGNTFYCKRWIYIFW